MRSRSATSIVKILKNEGQDYEWYPTTDIMLLNVQHDIKKTIGVKPFGASLEKDYPSFSLLDIGAGDGKALEFLGNGDNYLIEKSPLLINQNNTNNMILGVDFITCSLIDKKVDVIFSNPPYSEYVDWSVKIITEANCQIIYLVIPERWENNKRVKKAIQSRNAEKGTEVIYEGDFLDAERKARANVHIVKIDLGVYEFRGEKKRTTERKDPFDKWFETEFQGNKSDIDLDDNKAKTFNDKVRNQLTTGRNIVDILVELYDTEIKHVQGTYKNICNIDFEVLEELDVSASKIKGFLKKKISGVKYKYWERLFEQYKPITGRLTSKTVHRLKKKIFDNTNIEFSSDNAYAITGWVIRNANKYYDEQLITFFNQMIAECNITVYKSNIKTFKNESWRFLNTQERRDRLGKVKLEYRIVCSEGGIYNGSYGYDNRNGLDKSAHSFINDALVIANNLGFNTGSDMDLNSHDVWTSGKKHSFYFEDENNEQSELMVVSAYKKGNLHIQFNQAFIKKLNVVHGKLKGWLKRKEDIETELGDDYKNSTDLFDHDIYRIPLNSVKLLED